MSALERWQFLYYMRCYLIGMPLGPLRSRYTKNKFKAISRFIPCMPSVLIDLIAEYDFDEQISRLFATMSLLNFMFVYDKYGNIIARLHLSHTGPRRKYAHLDIRGYKQQRMSITPFIRAIRTNRETLAIALRKSLQNQRPSRWFNVSDDIDRIVKHVACYLKLQ